MDKLYLVTDYFLVSAKNYFGEIFELNENDLKNNIDLYIKCLIEFKRKKYFIKTKERFLIEKRPSKVFIGKKELMICKKDWKYFIKII